MSAPFRHLLRTSLAPRPSPFIRASLLTRAYAKKPNVIKPNEPPAPTPPNPTPAPTALEEADKHQPTLGLPTTAGLDFSSEDAKANPLRQSTGAKSAKEASMSSFERKRRFVGRLSMWSLILGLVGGYVYMGLDSDEKTDGDNSGKLSSFIARANRRTSELTDVFVKPIWKELLPPPLPEPYQKKYTLLISIDDLLVTSVWDRQHGWRTAKRPGVDYFLSYLSNFYEIVVFTTQTAQTAYPIMDKLDPFNYYVLYQLFRESTRTFNGKIVKDLEYLNRDLSHVIAIDTVAERYSLQPENAIILPKWKGDPKDTGLIGLIPFLESVGILNPPDVRPILKAYEGKDIAIEYAKVEALNKQRILAEYKSKASSGKVSNLTLSNLFSKPSPTHSVPTIGEDGVPLTYLEQKRKLAQLAYLEEQEYLKKNYETMKKMKEEHQEAAMKEMQEEGLRGMLARMGIGSMPPPKEQKEGEQPAKTV